MSTSPTSEGDVIPPSVNLSNRSEDSSQQLEKTFTSDRPPNERDVQLLHEIVDRAHNDDRLLESPRDALLDAYGSIYNERKACHRDVTWHQDRACFHALQALLSDDVQGETLYDRLAIYLRSVGVELKYDDDLSIQDDNDGPQIRREDRDGVTTYHLSPRKRTALRQLFGDAQSHRDPFPGSKNVGGDQSEIERLQDFTARSLYEKLERDRQREKREDAPSRSLAPSAMPEVDSRQSQAVILPSAPASIQLARFVNQPRHHNAPLLSRGPLEQGKTPVFDHYFDPEQDIAISDQPPNVDWNSDVYIQSDPSHYAHMVNYAEAFDKRVILSQTWANLRRAVNSGRIFRLQIAADELYQARLRRRAYKQVLAVYYDRNAACAYADRVYAENLLSRTLRGQHNMYGISKVNRAHNDRLQGDALYQLTLAQREADFVRRRQARQARSTAHALWLKLNEQKVKRDQLHDLLRDYEQEDRSRTSKAALQLLIQKQNESDQQRDAADMYRNGVLCETILKTWRSNLARTDELNSAGNDAREYFLLHRSVERLKSLRQYRRDRRYFLGHWAIQNWKRFVKHSKHQRYDNAYRTMRRTIKTNLVQRTFDMLRSRHFLLRQQCEHADSIYHLHINIAYVQPSLTYLLVQTRKIISDRVQAVRTHDATLTTRALAILAARTNIIANDMDKANRLAQYRTEQFALSALRSLHLRAFNVARRRADADTFRSWNERKSMRDALAKIRLEIARRRGQQPVPRYQFQAYPSVGENPQAQFQNPQTGNDISLLPLVAMTPARKRSNLLLGTTASITPGAGTVRFQAPTAQTGGSTTPTYTPFRPVDTRTPFEGRSAFARRLREGPRMLEDIEGLTDMKIDSLQDENGLGEGQDRNGNANGDVGSDEDGEVEDSMFVDDQGNRYAGQNLDHSTDGRNANNHVSDIGLQTDISGGTTGIMTSGAVFVEGTTESHGSSE